MHAELIFYLVQIARAQPSFQIFGSVDQLYLAFFVQVFSGIDEQWEIASVFF